MIEVSTTSTNIAIASKMASVRFMGDSSVVLTRSASVTWSLIFQSVDPTIAGGPLVEGHDSPLRARLTEITLGG
jgi:hypothetical protein